MPFLFQMGKWTPTKGNRRATIASDKDFKVFGRREERKNRPQKRTGSLVGSRLLSIPEDKLRKEIEKFDSKHKKERNSSDVTYTPDDMESLFSDDADSNHDVPDLEETPKGNNWADNFQAHCTKCE